MLLSSSVLVSPTKTKLPANEISKKSILTFQSKKFLGKNHYKQCYVLKMLTSLPLLVDSGRPGSGIILG